jgi:hypothetical protein
LVISHKYRCIFWKPHKVASTSVMVALGKQCGEHDSVGGISGGVETMAANYRRNMWAFSQLQTPVRNHSIVRHTDTTQLSRNSDGGLFCGSPTLVLLATL